MLELQANGRAASRPPTPEAPAPCWVAMAHPPQPQHPHPWGCVSVFDVAYAAQKANQHLISVVHRLAAQFPDYGAQLLGDAQLQIVGQADLYANDYAYHQPPINRMGNGMANGRH